MAVTDLLYRFFLLTAELVKVAVDFININS